LAIVTPIIGQNMENNFLEVMPNPVILYDSHWKIRKINQAAINLLRYSDCEELLGQDIEKIVWPPDLELLEEIRAKTEKEEEYKPGRELHHLCKDGGKVKMVSHFRKICCEQTDTVQKIIESGIPFEDIVRRYHEQLEKLHCWRSLAENVPGLNMMLVDKSLKVHCVVGSEKQKKSLILHDSVQEDMSKYFPQSIVNVLTPLLKIAFESTPVSREFSDGKEYYSVRLNPLAGEGGEIMCVIILQNITESKVFEKKLKLSKQEAEEANEAKSTFIAKMSHEIRTPLSAVIGFAEQLGKTRLSKKQNSYLKIINNSSEHLLSIIDDILVLSKIEAGQIEFEKVPFRISHVLKTVRSLLDLRYKKKNLSFNTFYDLSLDDEVVLGDPGRLRQVLINLINNAIKFTHKGGITVSCSPDNITAKQIIVRFTITDTGIGIPPEELEGIFAPFRQVDNSIGRSYFGSGLGLSISKNLIEKQGGSISVKSIPGKGSTFTFTVKYKRTSQPIPDDTTAHPVPSGILLDHVKLLFVDDDPMNQLLGKEILRQYKIKTVFAGSGEEAIKLFKPGRFDMVFLDINMPVISGIDVARHIREAELSDKKKPATKIIAMTANVLKSHIEKYLRVGMDDVIIKPFKEETLYEMIAMHAGKPAPPAKNKVSSNDNHLQTFDLTGLERFTKGNAAFTMLMLTTFIENSEQLLKKIKMTFAADDYGSVAEAAHRLLPSFEQLGFKKATALLREIDTRYLRKKTFRKDPDLIETTIKEIGEALKTIKHAKSQINK
jgi:PAS domain S-box-containing protein